MATSFFFFFNVISAWVHVMHDISYRSVIIIYVYLSG
ncbi:hypothetical protein GLYMA_19G138951v4 [Glycine max]|nr:hypothetical protein GLYMA_19G138951v4 [Glycine max]